MLFHPLGPRLDPPSVLLKPQARRRSDSEPSASISPKSYIITNFRFCRAATKPPSSPSWPGPRQKSGVPRMITIPRHRQSAPLRVAREEFPRWALHIWRATTHAATNRPGRSSAGSIHPAGFVQHQNHAFRVRNPSSRPATAFTVARARLEPPAKSSPRDGPTASISSMKYARCVLLTPLFERSRTRTSANAPHLSTSPNPKSRRRHVPPHGNRPAPQSLAVPGGPTSNTPLGSAPSQSAETSRRTFKLIISCSSSFPPRFPPHIFYMSLSFC